MTARRGDRVTLLTLSVSLALTCALAARDQAPSAQTAAPAQTAAAVPTLRLPAGVRPTRQAIALTLDPRQEKFSGTVDIDVTLESAVPTIWLHAQDLSIREATLDVGGRQQPLRTVPGAGHVIGVASPNGSVGPGAGRLHIAYDGTISRRDTEGLFAQQDGSEWYAFTQFEALAARRAFPCFDEPGFKIPWQVTLTVPKDDLAFSNTPETSTAAADDGMKRVAFAETKPLPSYLVAFAVGPFELVDAGRAGRKNTAIRIIVPRGRSPEARWAVESTPKILASLEDYFDLPYPYEKLDQVSIPSFPGAMENPSLVTYGQTIILQNPEAEAVARRRTYVSIAAHELAHQWFGDLVTTAWWDDIWLNESFASWLGQRITGRFGPDWGIDVERVASRSGALDHDSLSNARRIRQPIESEHDISNAFDSITYEKGEAVLEMFEAWLGEDVFRRGVQQYIRKHEWGNATVDDFTAAISSAAGRDLAAPFSSFLDQPGAPLVTIETACDAGKVRLRLSQKRYLPLGSRGDDTTAWQVPVCVRYDAGGREQRQCTLLAAASADIGLDAATSCPSWVLGNDHYLGYYRTRYAADGLDRLLHATPALNTAERVGVLTDLPSLIASGDVPAARALETASTFAADPERHIVGATMKIVEGVRKFVPETQDPGYAALIRQLYGPRARDLGWHSRTGESDDARLLREDVLRIVGTLGKDESLAREALPLANRWLDDLAAIEPDFVDVTLAVAARSGNRAFFDRLHDAARREKDPDRLHHLLEGLGSFRAPDIVPGVLAITLEPEINPQASMRLLVDISSDRDTRQLAYDFVKGHFDALVARMPHGSVFDVASILPFVGAGFCDEAHRRDVEAFFGPRVERAAGGPRNLAQALELIDLCVAQREVQEPSVSSFLAGLQPSKSR